MLRKSTVAATIVLTTVCFATAPSYAKKKKSSPEDLAKVVELSRALEADPLAPNAADSRKWLVKWLEKAPDITVTIAPLLGPLPSDDYSYSQAVFTQMIFSNAAFVIENLGKTAVSPCAEQVAGVVGALRAYQVIVSRYPDAKYSFLEDLLEKEQKGELEAYVLQTAPESCATEAD